MSDKTETSLELTMRYLASRAGPKLSAPSSLAAPHGSASVLELGRAKSNDAHCLACGFKMLGGADVGLCPKCGSDRWYKTQLL